MSRPLELGSGLGVDRVTLRTVVTDPAAFSATVGASADPADRLLAALVTGRLDDAQRLADELLVGDPSFRVPALSADVLSRRGDHVGALARHRELLTEVVGSPREAVVRQHLGKTLFDAGEWLRAREQFAAALRLRETADAPADQVASSLLALQRLDEVLADAAVDRGWSQSPGRPPSADSGQVDAREEGGTTDMRRAGPGAQTVAAGERGVASTGRSEAGPRTDHTSRAA